MSNYKELEELLLGESGILVNLRLGEGLDESKVDKVYKLLKKIKIDYEESDSIPKKIAELFVDFYPAIESTYELYDEKTSTHLMDIADKVLDLIRDCIT